MLHDYYTSLITRQINAIARAEFQTITFLTTMKEMDRVGKKLTDGAIAAWLQAKGVKYHRKGGGWTDKAVYDKFYIDEVLSIEDTREDGQRIAGDYRSIIANEPDTKIGVQLIRWLKLMNKKLPKPAATIEEAIDAMAKFAQDRADVVGRELRAARRSYE